MSFLVGVGAAFVFGLCFLPFTIRVFDDWWYRVTVSLVVGGGSAAILGTVALAMTSQ